MKAHEPTLWEFRYVDTDVDEPVHHFMEMHEKLMHTVVVSSDLAEFSHIHPLYEMNRHRFFINVNSTTGDYDNQDLPHVVTRGGRYFVFSSTMPMPPEIMMTHSFDVESEGESQVKVPLVPELTRGDVDFVKYYNEDGSTGQVGSQFEVTIKMELMKWCNWYIPRFQYQLRVWDPDHFVYRDAENFQPWLAMGGHIVMVSEAGQTAAEKKFYHLHSFMPISRAGHFKFPFSDHKNPLPNGNYKIWAQFRYENKILTLPLVISFNPPPFNPGRAVMKKGRCG